MQEDSRKYVLSESQELVRPYYSQSQRCRNASLFKDFVGQSLLRAEPRGSGPCLVHACPGPSKPARQSKAASGDVPVSLGYSSHGPDLVITPGILLLRHEKVLRGHRGFHHDVKGKSGRPCKQPLTGQHRKLRKRNPSCHADTRTLLVVVLNPRPGECRQ